MSNPNLTTAQKDAQKSLDDAGNDGDRAIAQKALDVANTAAAPGNRVGSESSRSESPNKSQSNSGVVRDPNR